MGPLESGLSAICVQVPSCLCEEADLVDPSNFPGFIDRQPGWFQVDVCFSTCAKIKKLDAAFHSGSYFVFIGRTPEQANTHFQAPSRTFLGFASFF